MRFILPLLLFLILPVSLMAQDRNIPYFDSIPLMNGFHTSQDDVMIFDKPEGRIIEVFVWCEAECPSVDAILSYYKQSLTSLGWLSVSGTQFRKKGHTLSFGIQHDPTGSSTVILFQSNG